MDNLQLFMEEKIAYEYNWQSLNMSNRFYKYNKSLNRIQYTDDDVKIYKKVKWRMSTFSLNEIVNEIVEQPNCWISTDLKDEGSL